MKVKVFRNGEVSLIKVCTNREVSLMKVEVCRNREVSLIKVCRNRAPVLLCSCSIHIQYYTIALFGLFKV